MNRTRTFLALFSLAGALLLAAPRSSSAEVSIHFSTGHGHQAGQHRGFRSNHRGPRHHRGKKHHNAWRRLPFQGWNHRHRHRNHRPRHVAPGSGCHAVTSEAHDAHGRLILLRQTLCYDRYGDPYILGGDYR